MCIRDRPKADLNRIREKAGEMKAALEDILASGLSRTASQSADALERLAVISHNEGLASFEDAFRSLQNGYEAYFSRSSSVNAAGLMDESARLYEQICRLSRVKTDGELRNLGGVFHMDYEPAGDMELIGITAVSYTHLDVYKRQSLGCIAVDFCMLVFIGVDIIKPVKIIIRLITAVNIVNF